MVKQVAQLKALVERSDIPVSRELEANIAKLSEAAEKAAQLKTPDQLPKLREIITNEIKPQLAQTQETLNRDMAEAVQVSARYRQAEDIQNRVRDLQRDLDIALKKLPSLSGKELEAELKQMEQVLNKVMSNPESAAAAETPQFSESIQTLYENMKAALKLLQSNLQVSNNQLEVPEEIRQ
ncbi:MAG: hypothetical protein GY940_13640, partial [bacterium]|nr:hypothetical protein [bacterium]